MNLFFIGTIVPRVIVSNNLFEQTFCGKSSPLIHFFKDSSKIIPWGKKADLKIRSGYFEILQNM